MEKPPNRALSLRFPFNQPGKGTPKHKHPSKFEARFRGLDFAGRGLLGIGKPMELGPFSLK